MDVIASASLPCLPILNKRGRNNGCDLVDRREPAFKALGHSAQRRIDSESEARKYRLMRDGLTEVTLANIYSPESLRLGATPAQSEALIEAELVAEERACAPFPPVVELMRAAKAKGMSIAVVSDTYLTEAQLRRLLASALPADAMAMIERVFCSSEHGRSKSAGLFELVLPKLGRKASEVLHVGDNTVADFLAPRANGMHAVHLVHHDPVIDQMLRMQTLAYNLQHTAARNSESSRGGRGRALRGGRRRALAASDGQGGQ